MEVLVIVSLHIRINEIKKSYDVLDDLIEEKIFIYLLNVWGQNNLMKKHLIKHNYDKFKVVGNASYSLVETLALIKNIENMIVIGLKSSDPLTEYLYQYIGTNTNIFVVAPNYGVYSDATLLINEGAYLMSTRYDLKNVWVDKLKKLINNSKGKGG